MTTGGVIDFIMDIIRDKVECAKADDERRTYKEYEQRLKQQKSNLTSASHKNQGR